MSKALRNRLLEHAAALALVGVIAVVIGWCLTESHQGVLEATGRASPSPVASVPQPQAGPAVLAVTPGGTSHEREIDTP